MALVKCTKTVFDHVNSQIDKLFQDRLVEAYKLRGMTDREVAEIIYAETHTPERIKAAKDLEGMHDSYQLLFKSETIKFKLKVNQKVTRNFEVKLGTPKEMIHPFMSQYGDLPKISKIPKLIQDEILAADERFDAVKVDRDTFKSNFREAWNKVKSVNEMIKVWPAVADLLPPDAIERINRKNGPRTKQEESFDATALNVQLLKAKVAK